LLTNYCSSDSELGTGNELEPVDEAEESKDPEGAHEGDGDEDDEDEEHKVAAEGGKTTTG